MSLMREEEWDDSDHTPEIKSTKSINSHSLSSLQHQPLSDDFIKFIEPKSQIPNSNSNTLGHPVKKFALVIMVILAISLPVASYVIANKVSPGGLDIPLTAFGLSSIAMALFIVYFYKVHGAKPYIKSKPIVILMALSFLFYSLYLVLYAMYLVRPFYDEETKEYSGISWLIIVVVLYFHFTVFLQYSLLAQCSLRSKPYLYLISYPSSIFFTSIILSIPLYLFVGFIPPKISSFLMLLPFALGLIGIFQTLRTRSPNKWSVKEIYVKSSVEEDDQLITKRSMKRVVSKTPKDTEIVDFKQPLSIIQIADPHIGPMMSIERLQEICENTVKLNPDLVLLTGDFFTTESFNPENSLEIALSPLKKLPSHKLFACLGNHDYEEGCLEILERALESINCTLLVDRCVLVETRIGKVQIVGFDYRKNQRQEHITQVCSSYPPIPGVPRIGLLHDPGAFKFIPPEYGLITFSGHTHGGQIGLNCLGVNISLVGLTGMPDHSLWQNGNNYLYVHTGQGCRSFLGTMVLRVGVPTEDSLLQVFFEN
ncbi:hypothetical protein DICPUDRAFT_149369 [Dictyostelium purpureum]|uniref:Calcineurin-like phosphoesterase domain-containing protein n=1 Tax=Dictyostelium purpureum TaxID=5786 RepID=F0ZDI9_DICPU|nr:uncharacterized protein DICPUDRAFT_149369 [Dictyostelium purpureum]EGC38006.1 hypothetical protein DICPUDRAFT_149369 [Dictyostelium purpureum]|eukprot:XP_003285490.1 hypothetical protein DICPUDRAFT_149369 [Dictyostelium purpureum]